MAVVHRMEHISLDKDSPHTDVDGTYSIVTDDKGRRYLQIDTYGIQLEFKREVLNKDIIELVES